MVGVIYESCTPDSKNFINIQMGQMVPIEGADTCRVRTGYERVLAHRTRMPFAYVAEQDGVILEHDTKNKLIKIKYKDGKLVAVKYGEQYTANPGAGFVVTQRIVFNSKIKGKRISKHDVICYNQDFFAPDPFSSQVDAKLGVNGKVALVESATTMEDGCVVGKRISKLLVSKPVQVREVVIKKSTIVHKFADVGTEVLSATPLLIFDDSIIPDEYQQDADMLDTIKRLNRRTPKAKYTGKVVKIEAFYKDTTKDMSDSLRKLVTHVSKSANTDAKFAKGTVNEQKFWPTVGIAGDRVGQVDFDTDTVVLRFSVQQTLDCNGGDKVVFGGALKSVCAKVDENPITTEDGKIEVDALMSATSVHNRMVVSTLIVGATTRILETMEQEILNLYFND